MAKKKAPSKSVATIDVAKSFEQIRDLILNTDPDIKKVHASQTRAAARRARKNLQTAIGQMKELRKDLVTLTRKER